MWTSTFHTNMTLLQSYAGSKQISYETTKINTFITKEQEKPHTNVEGLNMVVARLMTIQATDLPF
jgi:hypothetical protein